MPSPVSQKWLLRNDVKKFHTDDSSLTRSASDWLTTSKICFFQSEHEHEHELGRDTPSIWEFLCLLIPRQTSGGITKCWLFSLVVHIITYCMLKLTWAIINCNHAIINWLEVNVHERTPQITDLAWTFFHGEWLAIHRRIDSCFKTSTWFMTSQGWDKYTWIQLLLKQNRFHNCNLKHGRLKTLHLPSFKYYFWTKREENSFTFMLQKKPCFLQ